MIRQSCVCVAFLGFAVATFGVPAGATAQKKEGKKAMYEWGPEKNGVRCAVALTANEKIYAGEPIQILLLTKNDSGMPVSIVAEAQILSVFKIRVLGPDGNAVPLTAYGRQQMEVANDGSRGSKVLAAGEQDRSGLLLNRCFDMTRQGEYKVSFSRSVGVVGNMDVVVPSNVLTITVLGERTEYQPK